MHDVLLNADYSIKLFNYFVDVFANYFTIAFLVRKQWYLSDECNHSKRNKVIEELMNTSITVFTINKNTNAC